MALASTGCESGGGGGGGGNAAAAEAGDGENRAAVSQSNKDAKVTFSILAVTDKGGGEWEVVLGMSGSGIQKGTSVDLKGETTDGVFFNANSGTVGSSGTITVQTKARVTGNTKVTAESYLQKLNDPGAADAVVRFADTLTITVN